MPPALAAALDQFEKPALSAVGRAFLVKEFQILLVELLEEFVPGNFFQILVVLERDAQHAGFLAAFFRAAHAGGFAAALLRPFADFLMIGSGFRFMRRGHAASLLDRARESDGAARPGRDIAPASARGDRRCVRRARARARPRRWRAVFWTACRAASRAPAAHRARPGFRGRVRRLSPVPARRRKSSACRKRRPRTAARWANIPPAPCPRASHSR